MGEVSLDALCRMPADFHGRGDVSMVTLLRESGYEAGRSVVSEAKLEAYLREAPDLVLAWIRYSEDRRCSPGWYMAQPGQGHDRNQGWRVGYYTERSRLPERLFPDECAACAFFIMRTVDELWRSAS